jgi:hypothetical protein
VDDLHAVSEGPCGHCPVGAGCISLRTAGRGLCDWVDPSSPRYKPGGAGVIESRSSLAVAVAPPLPRSTWHERPPEPEEGLREARGPDVAPRGSQEPTRGPARGLRPKLLEDEGLHVMVYEAARTCEHRVKVELCCGSADACGPGGFHADYRVDAGICYACTVKRLGLEEDARYITV